MDCITYNGNIYSVHIFLCDIVILGKSLAQTLAIKFRQKNKQVINKQWIVFYATLSNLPFQMSFFYYMDLNT